MKRFFSNPFVALAAGAGLRLFFVFRFPSVSGDTVLYDQFATNWLKLGKLAMDINGQPVPVDLRMPGYPAFLAIVYALTGRTGESARMPVLLAQTIVDLGTCVVIAALAALLANLAGQREKSRRVFATALWLAVLCPFTANYVAVPLTEIWAAFFSAMAFYFLSVLATQISGNAVPLSANRTLLATDTTSVALLAGVTVGFGTLFRPETPLLLATTIPVFALFALRRRELARWVRVSALLGIACLALLLPWTIRNAITLHEFQPLAPKDATLPSELDPKGFMAWERTWLYRVRDTYLVTWKLNDDEIHLEDIPPAAFDNQQERDRVADVLEKYNDDLTWNAEEDAEFAQLARERTARHPLRTFLWIPMRRAVRIWFTPRIELLPVSGHVFPLAYQWEEDPVDQRVTILFFLGNVLFAGLGMWGTWKLWKTPAARPAVVVLLTYIMVRTAFLTTLEAPEPRYTLVCFPALLAIAAQVAWRKSKT
jgi:hypothetical protein